VARIEAIRLFLAYASFKDFVVYQMDVKSDFLYRKIKEEVYVCQPPGFEDLNFLDKVYKVKKKHYMDYINLLEHGDNLLVQVYVDDIIFGSTKKELRIAFKKMMHEKFQMSSMGKLTFFLRLQVKQEQDGIFISQDKYVAEILRKYRAGKGFSRRETPLYPTMMVQAQEEMHEGSAIPTNPQHTPIILQPSTSQHQKKQKARKAKRKVTKVPQPSDPMEHVADEAVNEEMDESLVRVATTSSSLEAEQDSGNINKTYSKATPNKSNSQGTDSGVNIPRSDEDSLKLKELMELCTNLQNRVLDLENTKTIQALEIDNLKRRVKKLEKKQKSRTHKLKRLYKVGLTASTHDDEQIFDADQDLGGENASKQGRISDIDADEGITLVSTHDDEQIFDADQDLGVQVSTATTTATISIDEVTLAQELAELKQTKPKAKAKGIIFHKQEESTTTTTIPKPKSQDKGKAIM
nr:putative ribonuclease H-like domain-containing protein [Tanacetum cinerariifolium]